MIRIGDRPIDLNDIRATLAGPVTVELTPQARGLITRSAETVARLLKTGDAIYGVNTGFGKLAKTRIADKDLNALQINIVRSHAAGVGAPLDGAVVRLIMLMKLNALAQGASGISLAAMETLAALINADVLPVIPGQGSVGASGDLAPLAHMSLVLIGEGEAMVKGERVPGAKALEAAGVQPVALGPKEGLALLNGTQVSTALALAGLIGGRAQCRSGGAGGCHVGRCGDGLRHAVRSAHPCAAPASRPAAGGVALPPAAGGQRHPRLASERRRPGAGPLFLPLPAAGDGRVSRSSGAMRRAR